MDNVLSFIRASFLFGWSDSFGSKYEGVDEPCVSCGNWRLCSSSYTSVESSWNWSFESRKSWSLAGFRFWLRSFKRSWLKNFSSAVWYIRSFSMPFSESYPESEFKPAPSEDPATEDGEGAASRGSRGLGSLCKSLYCGMGGRTSGPFPLKVAERLDGPIPPIWGLPPSPPPFEK